MSSPLRPSHWCLSIHLLDVRIAVSPNLDGIVRPQMQYMTAGEVGLRHFTSQKQAAIFRVTLNVPSSAVLDVRT